MTFASHFDLQPDTAAKLGAPFGGGVARRGETCGAVNGAFMVLGLKYGHISAEDQESKEASYRGVQEFIAQFQERNGSIICNELLDCDISTPEGLQSAYVQERNGSIICNELLDCDISTPEGLQSAYDAQLFNTRCLKFVGDAAEILNQIMGLDEANNQP
jgi:C_GCAxxG_C_C family probable redox protein